MPSPRRVSVTFRNPRAGTRTESECIRSALYSGGLPSRVCGTNQHTQPRGSRDKPHNSTPRSPLHRALSIVQLLGLLIFFDCFSGRRGGALIICHDRLPAVHLLQQGVIGIVVSRFCVRSSLSSSLNRRDEPNPSTPLQPLHPRNLETNPSSNNHDPRIGPIQSVTIQASPGPESSGIQPPPQPPTHHAPTSQRTAPASV